MPAKKRLTKERSDEPFSRIDSTARDYQETALKNLKRAQEEKHGTNTRKRYLNFAIDDSLDAAHLYENEKRFGPAEKMYKLAEDLSQTFSGEYGPRKSVISKLEYRNAIRNNELAGYRSQVVHKERLVGLGKYLQRREDRGSEVRTSSALEKASGLTAIIGIFGGIFFFSDNITGNVIGSNTSSSNIIGIILLLVGIVGAFFYFRNRK